MQFCALGLSSTQVPTLAPTGSTWGSSYASVLPTVLFNYGFVAAVPSWLNEKGPAVLATNSILTSIAISTALYLALGLFGAASPLAFGGTDFLSLLVNGDNIWTVSKVAVYVFPAANLMTSIPIFSLLVRYNLVNAEVMSEGPANAVAVGVPWIMSLIFYSGNLLGDLINWSAALLFAAVNLVVPIVLYLSERVNTALSRGAAVGSLAVLKAVMRERDVDVPPGGESALLDESSPDGGGGGGGNYVVFDDSLANPAWADETANVGNVALITEDIRPTTRWFRRNVLTDASLAAVLLFVSVLAAIAAIVLQAQQESSADDDY